MDVNLDMINQLHRMEHISDIGQVLGLWESTVYIIRDNADKIKKHAQSGTATSIKKT